MSSVPGSGSQIRGWANCAVLVSFLLGRGYRTWTPHGFYRRLKRECGVRPIDVSLPLAREGDELTMALQMIAGRDSCGDRMLRSSPQLLSSDAGPREYCHNALEGVPAISEVVKSSPADLDRNKKNAQI